MTTTTKDAARATADPGRLEDQVCYALYSASLAVQRRFKPVLDELGITYPQYLALHILWTEDGQTVGAIAERLSLDPSTMTPLLKRLQAAGFVERARNPEDERQVLIRLTAKGVELSTEIGRLREALTAGTDLEADELRALSRTIGDLRDRLA